MLFINTRPSDRAQALTECLSQAGVEVVELPLLELKPRAFNLELEQLYRQLSDTQVIVVVSPTAVDIGMQYLQLAQISLSNLQHIQWIAVGQKTAQTLAQYAIQSHVPEVETSEGMLSLAIFKSLQNLQQIAFWRGEGGRQFMMQQCQDRHIDVVNFVLYERACPASTFDQYPQLIETFAEKSGSLYWMCISSEASWHNWLALNQGHEQVIQQCHYLVLGDRLYQLLRDDQKATQRCFNITQISNLEPHTILDAMKVAKPLSGMS